MASGRAKTLFTDAIILAIAVGILTGASREGSLAELKEQYRRPTAIPAPADNAMTRERVELGKTLFFDPRLSGSGNQSCASCHNPALSWTDNLPQGIGHGSKLTPRKTPTMLNLAWASALSWDGRAETLEPQALGPMFNDGIMAATKESLLKTIDRYPGYRGMFARAYPGEPIAAPAVGKAIAAFERSIVSTRAPFDRWIEGDEKAISAEAKRGFATFNSKARCAECHSGWSFTDHSFQDIGIKDEDIGAGKFLKLAKMQHAFKVPTLRNIAQRAPYMHNGSEKTLEDVIELYDRGGDVPDRPSLSGMIHPLHLAAPEKKDLIEFLKTLTGRNEPFTLPALPGGGSE